MPNLLDDELLPKKAPRRLPVWLVYILLVLALYFGYQGFYYFRLPNWTIILIVYIPTLFLFFQRLDRDTSFIGCVGYLMIWFLIMLVVLPIFRLAEVSSSGSLIGIYVLVAGGFTEMFRGIQKV